MTLDKQALQAAISKADASTFFEGGETYAEFVIRAYINALPKPEYGDLAERLRDKCNGHPSAEIAWPHRILHEAADAIEALSKGGETPITEEMVERAHARSKLLYGWAISPKSLRMILAAALTNGGGHDATTPAPVEIEPVAWGEFYGNECATASPKKGRHCVSPLYSEATLTTLQEEVKRLRLDNSLNEERVSSLMNERTNLIKTSREAITRYQEMLAREANEKVAEHRRAEAAEARVRELEAALKSKGE